MPDHGASLLRLTYANAHERLAEDGRRAVAMASSGRGDDAANIVAQALLREQRRLRSLSRFVTLDADLHVGSEYVERLSDGLGDVVKGILAEAAPHVPPDAYGTALAVAVTAACRRGRGHVRQGRPPRRA